MCGRPLGVDPEAPCETLIANCRGWNVGEDGGIAVDLWMVKARGGAGGWS